MRRRFNTVGSMMKKRFIDSGTVNSMCIYNRRFKAVERERGGGGRAKGEGGGGGAERKGRGGGVDEGGAESP